MKTESTFRTDTIRNDGLEALGFQATFSNPPASHFCTFSNSDYTSCRKIVDRFKIHHRRIVSILFLSVVLDALKTKIVLGKCVILYITIYFECCLVFITCRLLQTALRQSFKAYTQFLLALVSFRAHFRILYYFYKQTKQMILFWKYFAPLLVMIIVCCFGILFCSGSPCTLL